MLVASVAACGSGSSGDSPLSGDQTVLTVSAAGAGSGVVRSSPLGIECGADCSEAFFPDATVTLTAAPIGDSVFAGWFGAEECVGTGPCTLKMSAAKAVSAIFDSVGGSGGGLPGIGVTVAVTGSGTVTSSTGGVNCGPGTTSCDAAMPADTITTLTATPSAGQRFVGWSGACSGNTTCGLTVNSLLTVGAKFAPDVAGRFAARPFLFKADEVRLRASVAARDPEATGSASNSAGVPLGFLSLAQSALASRSSYSDVSTWNLALAGWLLNNPAMLQMARNEAMAIVAGSPSGDSGTSDNFQHVEDRLLNVAATADLAHAQFSSAQLAQVATWVNGTLTNWNAENLRFWPFDEPRNNYWQNGFLAHVIAGVATEGFNSQAASWRTKSEQMAAKFKAASTGPNWGGPLQTEGHYYSGYVSHALWAMELYDGAIGTNLVADSSFSPGNQLDLAMFQTRPHLTQFFSVGSEANNSQAVHTGVSLSYWYHLAHSGRYTSQAQHAKSILAIAESDNGNFWSRNDKGFVRFYWNLRRVGASPLSTKSTRLFVAPSPGAGLIGLRSAVGFQTTARAALLFATQFNDGPAYSHANPDAPGFQWASGADWLVTDPDVFGDSGILAEAGSAHLSNLSNIVTLAGQADNNSGAQPLIRFAQDNSSQVVPHFYAQIDARPYWTAATTYRRDYVWLDDLQVVVIFDRIVGPPAKTWRLHVPSQPTISGKLASYTVGGKTVTVRDLLAPGNGAWVAQNLRPSVTQRDVWRLSQDDSSNDYRSLKVLDVGGRVSSASITSGGGSHEAALVINGTPRRVTFFDSGAQATVQ